MNVDLGRLLTGVAIILIGVAALLPDNPRAGEDE